MLNVVLVEPQIPPNTGNIIRLCANINACLHIVHPIGFDMSEKNLRRASLDYSEFVNIEHYSSWDEFVARVGTKKRDRCFGFTAKTNESMYEQTYFDNDYLVFGKEESGFSNTQREWFQNLVTIPMAKNQRSLNLSNSVAIATYEAWRQIGFLKN